MYDYKKLAEDLRTHSKYAGMPFSWMNDTENGAAGKRRPHVLRPREADDNHEEKSDIQKNRIQRGYASVALKGSEYFGY